jgi:hypothetical protein
MLVLNLGHGFDVVGTFTDDKGEPKIIVDKRLSSHQGGSVKLANVARLSSPLIEGGGLLAGDLSNRGKDLKDT